MLMYTQMQLDRHHQVPFQEGAFVSHYTFDLNSCEKDSKKYEVMQAQLIREQLSPNDCSKPFRLGFLGISEFQCCHVVLNELGRAALPKSCEKFFQSNIVRFYLRFTLIQKCCRQAKTSAINTYHCCLEFVLRRRNDYLSRAKRYFWDDLPECCQKWFK